MQKERQCIAVNTRLLLKGALDGIAWFSLETLSRITKNHPEHDFHFFFDRSYDEDFVFANNVTAHVLQPPARHPFLFYIWFEWAVTRKLQTIKADFFLSPDGYLSLRTDVPSLAVIHDINFHHYPKDFPQLVERYYNYFFPRFAKKAKRIATVSQFSKQDIVDSYGVSADKIDVVYNGINAHYKVINASEQLEIRKRYSAGEKFFIFVGTLIPRKNISRLLSAYGLFQERGGEESLVVVGNKKWWTSEMEAALKTVPDQNKVIFTGYVDQADLYSLVGSATAMTFIPYFEGFGIPIIEAMQAGTPVITANASSTAEVAADAALLVDPYNVEEIAKAMSTISQNNQIQRDLREKGFLRAGQFSWDRTAELLWKSIEKALFG